MPEHEKTAPQIIVTEESVSELRNNSCWGNCLPEISVNSLVTETKGLRFLRSSAIKRCNTKATGEKQVSADVEVLITHYVLRFIKILNLLSIA